MLCSGARRLPARPPAALELLGDAGGAGGRRVDHSPDRRDRAGARRLQDGHRRHAVRRVPILHLRRCRAHAVLFAHLPRGARALPRRNLRARADDLPRNDGDDLGGQLHHAVHGARAAGALALRDGGDAPDLEARVRGGDEVLRARCARIGDDALRHVDDLRRDRVARPRPRRRGGPVGTEQPGHPSVRARVRRFRHRLQAGRCAVPHVGARRLRRSADGGDAADRNGAQARRVRLHAATPRARARRGSSSTGRGC